MPGRTIEAGGNENGRRQFQAIPPAVNDAIRPVPHRLAWERPARWLSALNSILTGFGIQPFGWEPNLKIRIKS